MRIKEHTESPPSHNTTQLLPVDGYPVQDPDSTYCAQVIQDYVHSGQRAHGHQLHLHPRHLYRWGASCAGHVLHANQAGALIQQQLQEWHEDGKTILEPEDINALNETIRANRLDYYAKRLKRIQENKLHDIGPQLNPDEQKLALKILRHIMALIANQESVNRNKNNTAFNTWQAMQHIAENLHPDLGAVQKCISKLEAIGAIRNMEFPTSFIQYKATTKKRTHDDASSLNPITDLTVEEPVRALSVTPPTLPIAYVDCAIPSLTNYVLSAFPDKKSGHRSNEHRQPASLGQIRRIPHHAMVLDRPTHTTQDSRLLRV